MKKRGENYIYLFRHGQTTYNRDHIFTGWKNPKLTQEGKEHAKKIAKKLKNKKIDLAIQSRLSRSKSTLKKVLEYHPECEKIVTDDRIIERSYGDLEGIRHEDFIKNMGRRSYELRVEGDAIENLNPELRKKVEAFLGKKEYDVIHRGYNIAARNGESFADVEKRVRDFIKDLKKLIKKEKINVAISAHGNSIRLFRKIMENASKKEVVSWFIPYDKVFVYAVR